MYASMLPSNAVSICRPRVEDRSNNCWSTPAIRITGRRPGVTSRGTVASPSSSHTSVVVVRV
jgi:hypothetical protein